MTLTTKKLVKAAQLLRTPYESFDKKLVPQQAQKLINITQKPKPLTYPLHPPPPNMSLDYPHPQPLKPLQMLPFHIERTNTGNIPVYIQYNCNHKIKRTVLRKISGDVSKLAEEIQKIVSNHEVRLKVGQIQIPGVHKESLLTWLIRLGL